MHDMTLPEICDMHCIAGITSWLADGAMIPKLWANGDGRIIAAQPTEFAEEPTADQRIELMWLMALACGADFVGRIDEAWIRETHPSENYDADRLDEHADTDPRIKTAIVVHGSDIATGTLAVSLAVMDLGPNGEPFWRRMSLDSSIWHERHTVTDAATLAAMAGPVNRDEIMHRLLAYAEGLAWAVLLLDDDQPTDYA